MIKLTLPPRPDFLTDDFIEERIAQFKANPKKRVWDIPALKEILMTASHGKCAFSEMLLNEEGKYMQVEHFFPKSKYPEKVLEWGNLLPCSNVCNAKKRDHDPDMHPLINPFFDDPKEYFFIENGRLFVIDTKNKKAVKTLEVYNLNEPIQLRGLRYRTQNEIKRRLLEIREDFDSNPTKGNNRLKSLMHDCGRTSAYSATKSTALLSDENFLYMKSVLTNSEEWEEKFLSLEEELKFCSLPKPIDKRKHKNL